jgi:hypothetical protein
VITSVERRSEMRSAGSAGPLLCALRRRISLMTSSTTASVAAIPTQIDHWANVSDAVTRIRCRNPIEVAAMIASSAIP